jgi:pantoate--beta-alanine ligase
MGALHAGHESLIRLARSLSEDVVVSIFVNPLQFENPEDLAKYPRTPESDKAIAMAAGASRVWIPTVEEIYPEKIDLVDSGEIGKLFEGAARAGHFDGMLTVVKRLFELTAPQWAIFGEKDFQQLFLVKSMVARFKLPIEIVSAPIIREPDGLAMSSRNIRLSPEGRQAATVISQALRNAAKIQDLALARRTLADALSNEPLFTIDYAEIVDEATFFPATSTETANRAIIAGWINGVRLLDNMAMSQATL